MSLSGDDKSVVGNEENTVQVGIVEIQLVSKDPMELFRVWFADAKQLGDDKDNRFPEAMTLSTVRNDGGPSARTVLLRGLDETGFKMYWDHRSRKTAEIEADSRGALVFRWPYKDDNHYPGILGSRQVRIEGHLEKLSEDDTSAYFNQEPYSAKFRATFCHQSRVIPDIDLYRKSLIDKISTLKAEGGGDGGNATFTKPDHWGGYRLVPHMMEFYQGQRDAVNDRIRFLRKTMDNDEATSNSGWVYEHLEP